MLDATSTGGPAPARHAKGPLRGADEALRILERLRLAGKDGHRRIRCPICAWRPTAASRWVCRPGCWHSWNTFDTGGRCPRCSFQWLLTACLRCHRVSRHAAWYEDLPAPE